MPGRLPKLERLVLDADVNAYLERYLAAIGFNVVFATRVDLDIHDDTSILRWARKNRRIYVCHDKFRDGPTRIKVFQEVYAKGGKILRIGGPPDQHPTQALGKILVHRHEWVDFFSGEGGIFTVYGKNFKKMNRAALGARYQKVLVDPTPPPQVPRRRRGSGRPRPKRPPPEQLPLNPPSE